MNLTTTSEIVKKRHVAKIHAFEKKKVQNESLNQTQCSF